NDALRVSRRQRARDWKEQLDRRLYAHSLLAIENVGDRLAVEQLHHEVRIAVRRLSEVEHVHDVGMPDARRRSGFDEEPIGGLLGRERRANELHRDVDVEHLVARHPDRSHPAFADFANELVLVAEKISRTVASARSYGIQPHPSSGMVARLRSRWK